MSQMCQEHRANLDYYGLHPALFRRRKAADAVSIDGLIPEAGQSYCFGGGRNDEWW
jgi:hypothetical protein